MQKASIRWFYLSALFTLALDQMTKAIVRGWLPLYESVPLISGMFHLTHIQNTGAAFGLFPDATLFFILIAIIACGLFLWLGHKGVYPKGMGIAFGLMLGGALGNLIDRLRYGAVTDFLDLRVWPVFNFADTALTVGAVLLLWWGWKGDKEAMRGEKG